MNTEKFSRSLIEVIAKRAGNRCSNPDCGCVTTGPAEDVNKAIIIGEAAHIYGGKPGAARFNEAMSNAERSDMTNAVWLCCNCHKMIDSDPGRYPAELIFEWRRGHERPILESLGKTGALLNEKITQKRFPEYERISSLAQQIILDKPYAWEYKLTAELIRSELEPIKARWEALEKGLYALPSRTISGNEYLGWFRANLNTLSSQVQALGGILNGELQKAFGPKGVPGSEVEIHRACALIVEACKSILRWEETVRFVVVPTGFEELQQLMVGIAGVYINKIFEIPLRLAEIFSVEKPTGNYELNLVFDLPPGWTKKVDNAIKKITKKKSWWRLVS